MPDDRPIYILLATYNGERFLRKQLNSLLTQSDPHWRLLVRDDGSYDGTHRILADFADQDPRIFLLPVVQGAPDATGNFFALMEAALAVGANYFALCDQDDLWDSQKLAKQRSALLALEARFGARASLLCWSDARWIDELDFELADSHFRNAGVPQAAGGPGTWLLAMNCIPGCTMMGNRALLAAALPRPLGIAHHDWWLALLAAATGHVTALERPLVGYRQHRNNVIGADPLARAVAATLHSPRKSLAQARRTYWEGVANARALTGVARGGRLAPEWSRAVAVAVTSLGSPSRWRRANAVVRGPVRRIGLARTSLMLAAALSSVPEG